MKNKNFISAALDRWAYKSKVRVYVSGVGGTTCEWDSLGSSFYEHLKPTVHRVYDVSEADLIALHGPFSNLALDRLNEMVVSSGLPLIGVGSELRVDTEGFLLNEADEKVGIKLSSLLTMNYPTPENLHLLATKALKDV